MTFFDPPDQHVQHRCVLPSWSTAKKGWRCDCGKAYVQEFLPARDVNPGELPWQWRRVPEHDGADIGRGTDDA